MLADLEAKREKPWNHPVYLINIDQIKIQKKMLKIGTNTHVPKKEINVKIIFLNNLLKEDDI